MKALIFKILNTTILTLLIATTVCADSLPYEFFSHAVVNLPLEVKSEEPWVKVITTVEDWNLFYSDLLWDGTSEPAEILTAPTIDFDSYQLLVGGLGLQMNGGFSVSIRKVIEFPDSLWIDVLIVRPGKDCIVTMALTYPTVAVLIKKTTKPIQFSFSDLIINCSPID